MVAAVFEPVELDLAPMVTIRCRMESSLSKQDWMRVARLALLRGGVQAVRVEKMARDMGVTKGSFYWHFADRGELLEALIAEWEAESDLITAAMGSPRQAGIRALLDSLASNVVASEQGQCPSDAAMFAWAAVSPEIAKRVSAAEEERLSLLAALLGTKERAELAYLAYLGFVLRRRHSSNARQAFQLVASLFLGADTDLRLPTGMKLPDIAELTFSKVDP